MLTRLRASDVDQKNAQRKEYKLKSRTAMWKSVAFRYITNLDAAFQVFEELADRTRRLITDPNNELLHQIKDLATKTSHQYMLDTELRKGQRRP